MGRSRLPFVALLALVSACVACHRLPRTQTPHDGASADLEAKTVALVSARVGEDGEPHAYCTGVWVGVDRFVTANHCVEQATEDGQLSYLARADLDAQQGDVVLAARLGVVLAVDEVHDLALVAAPVAPPHRWARVAEEQPTVGEPTQTMGHPRGLWYSYSTGVIAAVRRFGETWFVQTTAPISPGSSGGGVFNAAGELLGVAVSQMPRAQNVNLAVHAVHVRALLEGAK